VEGSRWGRSFWSTTARSTTGGADRLGEPGRADQGAAAGPAGEGAPAAGRAAYSAVVLVFVHVVLATAFTAMVIQYSRSYGRMLVGPLYDDVVYLDEGLRYAQLVQTKGVWALVQEAVGRPPHSPFAYLIALAGFLLCGPVEWAPYALMGLVVLAVVLAADRLLVGLPRHARVAGALLVLTFPIVGTLPYHFRPDATAGLATGFGVVMMLRHSPAWAPRAHQYWTGVCFALALLVKSPVAPFTLWMLAGSWGLSILAGGATDRFVPALSTIPARRRYWAAAWPYAAPVLLLAGPYYLIAGENVFRYIYENVFGANREIWRLRRGWLGLALFILDGEGGQMMLGGHVYLVIGLASGVGALHVVSRLGKGVDRERVKVALVLFGALFLAWLFPTLSRYGNPFTGAAFAAILLFVAVLLVRSLFVVGGLFRSHERLRRWVGVALGWSAIALAVLAFRWPAPLGTRTSDWVLNDNRVERTVYRAIGDHAAGSAATVFLTSAANLNAHLLQFRARADHAPLTLLSPPLSRNVEDYRPLIAASDYVVSGDPGAFREGRHLPLYEVQGRLLAELEADPALAVLATVPTYMGLNIYVFARKGAFGGWIDARGLGPLEGPFPPAGNKMVRWGLGWATHLTVTTPATRDGVIDFSAAAMSPGQAVEIVLNGATVRRIPLEPGGFETVRVPVSWRAGENRVELRYAIREPPSSDSGRAVLFRALRTD
jgi:hypothetical protein